jgi:1,6-anhydro-N-acetylmuramate kinase
MGAPLSGFFEAALLRHPTRLRVSQNLGGMGNVTVVPPNLKSAKDYIAFDTGPGNVLIDAAVREITNGLHNYDKDGLMGAAGESEVDATFIEDFMKTVGFFSQPPPKTTGRELFSDDVARRMVRELRLKRVSDNGIIANVTRLTGETVAQAYEQFVIPKYGTIDEIYVCGGGARNPNVMNFLKDRFPSSIVADLFHAPLMGVPASPEPTDANSKDSVSTHPTPVQDERDLRIPADAKEAILFAVLGFLCVCGRPVTIASNETNTETAILGKISPGPNYVSLMQATMDKEPPVGELGQVYLV